MDMSYYLRPEHRQAGIRLIEHEHYLELWAPWRAQAPIHLGIHSQLETIQHEADQILEQRRSGIAFVSLQEEDGE